MITSFGPFNKKHLYWCVCACVCMYICYLKWVVVGFLLIFTIGEISRKVLQHFLWNSKKLMEKKRTFLRRSFDCTFWSSEVFKLTFFSEIVYIPEITHFRKLSRKLTDCCKFSTFLDVEFVCQFPK